MAKSKVEKTLEEVSILEDLEYREATRKLLQDPAFHTFLVRWITESELAGMAPTNEKGLPLLNWNMGQASLMKGFMEGLRDTEPSQYMQLTQEVMDYYGRRKRADDRADRGPDDDGTVGGAGDAGDDGDY